MGSKIFPTPQSHQSLNALYTLKDTLQKRMADLSTALKLVDLSLENPQHWLIMSEISCSNCAQKPTELEFSNQSKVSFICGYCSTWNMCTTKTALSTKGSQTSTTSYVDL